MFHVFPNVHSIVYLTTFGPLESHSRNSITLNLLCEICEIQRTTAHNTLDLAAAQLYMAIVWGFSTKNWLPGANLSCLFINELRRISSTSIKSNQRRSFLLPHNIRYTLQPAAQRTPYTHTHIQNNPFLLPTSSQSFTTSRFIFTPTLATGSRGNVKKNVC